MPAIQMPAAVQPPLIGLQMLSDFAPGTRAQIWSGGTIYNPEDGRTYAATLTLRAPDLLEVEGCVLIICSGGMAQATDLLQSRLPRHFQPQTLT